MHCALNKTRCDKSDKKDGNCIMNNNKCYKRKDGYAEFIKFGDENDLYKFKNELILSEIKKKFKSFDPSNDVTQLNEFEDIMILYNKIVNKIVKNDPGIKVGDIVYIEDMYETRQEYGLFMVGLKCYQLLNIFLDNNILNYDYIYHKKYTQW